MPKQVDPAVLAAGIGAVSGAANVIATGNMNKKSRKFQEKMFHATNTYNSPIEQRKRLEAAGLNPNLVYGGSPGQTAGTANQPGKPDFETPDYNALGSAVQTGAMNIIQSKNIQSNTDVNQAREENIRADTTNAGLDAVNKTIRNAKDNLDYRQKNRLYETTIRIAQEKLAQLGIQNQYTAGKDTREREITDKTLEKMQTEIENNKSRGKILDDEAIMKSIDRKLYQDYKLRPNDPFYYRILGQIMESLGFDLFDNNFKY